MRLLRLILVLGEVVSLGARTLPIRHFEAKLIPLSITQDQQGVLWLATATGVWRFDGLDYEPVDPPPGIDLSSATHVAAAPDGSIWIGTAQGLVRYRDGSFSMELPGRTEALIVTKAGRLLAVAGERNHLDICLEPGRKPCQWAHLRGLTATGKFHSDLEGTLWFAASAYICSWSDADLQAAARGTSWTKLPRAPSIAAAAGAPKPFDWADVVRTPDHQVWGRNGPDVMRVENGRIVS